MSSVFVLLKHEHHVPSRIIGVFSRYENALRAAVTEVQETRQTVVESWWLDGDTNNMQLNEGRLEFVTENGSSNLFLEWREVE